MPSRIIENTDNYVIRELDGEGNEDICPSCGKRGEITWCDTETWDGGLTYHGFCTCGAKIGAHYDMQFSSIHAVEQK